MFLDPTKRLEKEVHIKYTAGSLYLKIQPIQIRKYLEKIPETSKKLKN